MSTQPPAVKGELIGEVRGKSTTTTIKEISPAGVRMEVNDQGEVKGRYNASHMETVSIWLKPDGTNEWENKGIQATREGDFIVVTGKGRGKSTGPTTGSWEGDITFMTQSKSLAWLNTTRGWVEGTGNNATGEFHGKVYAKK